MKNLQTPQQPVSQGWSRNEMCLRSQVLSWLLCLSFVKMWLSCSYTHQFSITVSVTWISPGGVTIHFLNDTRLTIWYKNNMSSFRAIHHDTIQWLEIDIVAFFCQNWEKENAYFYAVIEEEKHRKSLIHWTTQTFSARPRFNLCGPQTWTESLSFSVLLVLSCHDRHYLAQYTCPERHRIGDWTRVMFTIIYHCKCK